MVRRGTLFFFSHWRICSVAPMPSKRGMCRSIRISGAGSPPKMASNPCCPFCASATSTPSRFSRNIIRRNCTTLSSTTRTRFNVGAVGVPGASEAFLLSRVECIIFSFMFMCEFNTQVVRQGLINLNELVGFKDNGIHARSHQRIAFGFQTRCGDGDDLDVTPAFHGSDALGGFQSVHDWHQDIHPGQVGLPCRKCLDALLAVVDPPQL